VNLYRAKGSVVFASVIMGLCKCKKRTSLFCFVHKKAVCEGCIPTEHETCVVKTYLEWLQDSEYEPAVCIVCHGALTAENTTRLVCLDLIHTPCLDNHVRSLPPDSTASCPRCQAALLPPPSSTAQPTLARRLAAHATHAHWPVAIPPDTAAPPGAAALSTDGLGAAEVTRRQPILSPAGRADGTDDKYAKRAAVGTDQRLLNALLNSGPASGQALAETGASAGPPAPLVRPVRHPSQHSTALCTPRRLLVVFAAMFGVVTLLMMWTLFRSPPVPV